MPNYNPDTGIRFGVIAMNSLDQDLAQDLWYGPDAVNVDEQQAYEDAKAEIGSEWDAAYEEAHIAAAEVDPHADPEAFVERYMDEHGYGTDRDYYIDRKVENMWDHFQIDEPTIEGTYEGVKYMISWLGGAPLLWVLEGPVGYANSLCSPCVPGAADLDSGFSMDVRSGGHECYVVPQDWLEQETV